ncbi:MAG: DUF1501 domain-containing protein, partial [Planctomycetaceae bacterium]
RSRKSVASAMASREEFARADTGPRPLARGRGTSETPANDLGAFVSRSALDAYTTAERLKEIAQGSAADGKYPATEPARRLGLVARLVKAGFETPVYYVMQGGYDTHAVQLPTHANLLRELSGALAAFLDDLKESRLDDRVAVLVFSEFGRRVEENGSLGTDHGTAAPVFLAGAGTQSGLIGTPPSLTELEDGDLRTSIDFRRVYAAVLDQWLRVPSAGVLGDTFERLPLFRG